MVRTRLIALEFKAKRSSRAARMATAGNFTRKIVQTQKSAEQTDCMLSLPAHIQESKKLIKRNGETVEIVTLTLTSSGAVGSPKLVQQQQGEQQQVQQIVIEQAAATTAASSVSGSLTDSTGRVLSVGSNVKEGHGAVGTSTMVVDGSSDHHQVITTSATSDANIDQQHVQNVIVDSSHQLNTNTIPLGNNNNQIQPEVSTSADEFLMVTSTSDPTSNNGVTHGGVTFIATDPESATDSSGILGITSYSADSETAGTSGMASQHMSLVQRTRLSDNIIVAASSNNVEDYSFCLVCGDKGSGFHYSVFSCEGCKGFFKRSVQKNLTYTCKNDGSCDINRFSRNNCQYCRFKKCLQFGMKKEGVRDDRTPGGLTRARFKRLRIPENDVPVTESKQSQYQLENDIQLLVNCDPYISPSFVSSEEKTATLYGAFQLTAILYDDLIYTVKWAKQVLGFRTLEMEDQKRLLEGVLVELSLFRLAYRSFASEDDKLRFAHDIELTLAESEQLGFDSDYIKAIVTLIDRLRDLEIDDKEYAILCAIILFYEDTVGLRDTITVLKMQQKYLTILQRYIRLVYGGDLRRYGRMLLRLPALRTIAMEIDQVFEHFIVSDRPPITEMLDSALLDHMDTTEVESYDQMVITTVPDIQLEEHSVMEANVEADAADDITKADAVVEHVSIENV